ncbi:chorismate--pyruvate lyase family protein [Marinobacter shengliensis]|uniref:chorismate--pyruvate lyase family protein n=1 Tax=Marinobacter shengliensis TaxID=1389223 RepID=UPI000D0FA853|nr:chorismate lyase [Marinobacter shengliensis]PSF14644.1 chorismate--pyruvate lyase [Marinobacter shengliensis]
MPSKDSDHRNGPIIPPTRWYRSLAAAGLHNPAVHGPARHWLQVEGSFTRALQQQCRYRFHVEVCNEGFAVPTLEEARRLGLAPRQRAWIREVRLCGDSQPWVLARTVIPLACLEGNGRRLRNLGNKPLGAYLFSRPEWLRGPLETGLCQNTDGQQPQLARRSLFHRGNEALMVGEYLLPTLYQR